MSANCKENGETLRKKKKEEFIRTLSERFRNNQRRTALDFNTKKSNLFSTRQEQISERSQQISAFNNQKLARMRFNQSTRNKNTIVTRRYYPPYPLPGDSFFEKNFNKYYPPPPIQTN